MAAKKTDAEKRQDAAYKSDLGVDSIHVETVDNARAYITVGDTTTGLLDQADLHRLVKTLNRAVQSTY